VSERDAKPRPGDYDLGMRCRSGYRLLAAAVLSVSVWVLAACGRTTVVGGDRTVTLALVEYRLNPQDVRVSQGLLTVVVHNYGRLTHNLAISIGGQAEGSTAPLGPGESTQLTVQLSPGRYALASTILSDQALGAYGTLTVTR
jgi:hypothetical protein